MLSKSFGKPIKHADAKAYFDRYTAMKKKHGDNLRGFLKDDPEAQRFFCGRAKQDPCSEDWAYVFSKESLDRLLKLIRNTKADSLVIFQGTRNKEAGDPSDESDGRPTLLVFPATFGLTKDGDGEYHIGDDGEEHPGSGGGNGTSTLGNPPEFPSVLKEAHIHEML